MLEPIILYTEKHFHRVDKMLQDSFILDYILKSMNILEDLNPPNSSNSFHLSNEVSNSLPSPLPSFSFHNQNKVVENQDGEEEEGSSEEEGKDQKDEEGNKDEKEQERKEETSTRKRKSSSKIRQKLASLNKKIRQK